MKNKMKLKILPVFLLGLFALTACDSPRDRRANLTNTSLSNSYSNGVNYNNDRTNSGSNTDSSTGSGTTTNSSLPSDAQHCNFSTDGQNNYASQTSHISAFNVCKSSTDANTFYVQIKDPNSNSLGYSTVNICLIPMTSSNGSSIHVGNPQCGVFTDSKTVRKITFYKSSQYSSATINSIMIFKDLKYFYPGFGVSYAINTLQAYTTCMSYLNLYNNPYYCQAFKSAGYYSMFNQ